MLSICKLFATRGRRLKKRGLIHFCRFLSFLLILLCRKKVPVAQTERGSCGLQSSSELPSPLQCFVKTEEWGISRGGKKGKDSTRAHPTHSACHLPRRIIQSWSNLHHQPSNKKVPFAQNPLSFRGSFVSCTVIAVVGTSFIRLSILASTQNNLRSACRVMKYLNKDWLLPFSVWWSEIRLKHHRRTFSLDCSCLSMLYVKVKS